MFLSQNFVILKNIKNKGVCIMKYPLLKVKDIPTFYKHCGKVFVFHMEFKNKGFLDNGNQASKKAYLNSLQERVYELIESFHTVNLASRVISNKEMFVIFKTSLPEEQLLSFAKNLMTEISIYTDKGIQISYRIMSALIFEEHRPVKMTAMNKAGDDIKTSKEWEEQVHIFNEEKAPKGKYLKSYEEYIIHHPVKEEQEKNVFVVQSKTLNHSEKPEDESIMYYI